MMDWGVPDPQLSQEEWTEAPLRPGLSWSTETLLRAGREPPKKGQWKVVAVKVDRMRRDTGLAVLQLWAPENESVTC